MQQVWIDYMAVLGLSPGEWRRHVRSDATENKVDLSYRLLVF
jgi:hypothetical protein